MQGERMENQTGNDGQQKVSLQREIKAGKGIPQEGSAV